MPRGSWTGPAELRCYQLRIHRAYSSLLDQLNDGLGASLDATAEATGSQLAELILRARPRSRQPLSARLLRAVGGLAGSPLVRDSAEVFKVKLLRENGGAIEEIDLLSDHLVSVRRVVREHRRGRVLGRSRACLKRLRAPIAL